MPRGPAKCRTCRRPVVFLRSPFTGNVRTFDPTPVDGHHPLAVNAFPVMGRTAYKVVDLVELIQVQRQCSDVEADAEVRDMPWHVPHECTTPSTTDTKENPAP
ncbi:hypothetical protein [Nocardioides lianchengensis]|uniref:Uncharacterized protein n=1 Tax=Nocardioides lianchengensis TaxID=1045774 RepID=A0A1G6LPN3_9ACTN|nr:hypothetical protein [Nocardioides lianchengensis]NYG12483.1 hypothetical protein [Nocardioides lianchengensis]SDC45232.1 hypothetical protein SAMN05421872_102322 [Nocardioides lianchengensis]